MLFSDASHEASDQMTINRPSMHLPVSFIFSLPHSILLGPHCCVELTTDPVLQLLGLLGLLSAELGLCDRRAYHVGTAAGQGYGQKH
jgi:hypothetical protein